MKSLRTTDKGTTFFAGTMLRQIQLHNNNELLSIVRAAQKVARLDSENVKLLLERKADVNAENHHGQTPLECIWCPEHQISAFTVVKILVAAGAKIMRFLLDNGSRSVNGKNLQTGDTALHVAARRFDLENVKLLLEWKADVNAKNRHGQTPLGCIWIQRAEDQIPALAITKILMAAGAKLMDRGSRKIMASSLLSCGDRDVVRTLLQNRLDLTFRDEYGCTPAHYLSMNGCPGVFQELGDWYFDVNASCPGTVQTMLHLAAEVGNASTIKFLVDRGADVNARDVGEKTPLLCVIESALKLILIKAPYRIDKVTGRAGFDDSEVADGLNDYADCVEILLESSGADPQIFTTDSHHLYDAMFGEIISDGLENVITPVLARLALHEMSGRTVNRHTRNQIEMYRSFKTIFNSAKLQLEEIKRVKIGVSMTLFDFALATDAKISLYARNKRLVCDLTSAMEGYNSVSYYRLKLRKQFSKVTRLAEMRDKAAAFIGEIFRELCDVSVYNVAQRVVNYLDDQEMCKMVPISE